MKETWKKDNNGNRFYIGLYYSDEYIYLSMKPYISSTKDLETIYT